QNGSSTLLLRGNSSTRRSTSSTEYAGVRRSQPWRLRAMLPRNVTALLVTDSRTGRPYTRKVCVVSESGIRYSAGDDSPPVQTLADGGTAPGDGIGVELR